MNIKKTKMSDLKNWENVWKWIILKIWVNKIKKICRDSPTKWRGNKYKRLFIKENWRNMFGNEVADTGLHITVNPTV